MSANRRPPDGYDAIVIGSGFGGAMAAHEMVHAGWRVLMLERGDWVARGPQSAEPTAVGPLTPHYSTETPYRVIAGGEAPAIGAFHCVGGPSVFYGGASLRFRVQDFEPDPAIVSDSGARWPFEYRDLEPFYGRAERLLGVAGEVGLDPTEPWRSAGYGSAPAALSPTSRRIWQAAQSLGLHPLRLPLAFNHSRDGGRTPCNACSSCDGFACAVSAKNDIATAVLPGLLARGLTLRTGTIAVRLLAEGRRVYAVECADRATGRKQLFSARVFVLAGGALASPHLVLASGLHRSNPAGDMVGRYLMRHWNAVVVGVFPERPDPWRQFHKQIAIHDYYFGHPGITAPAGKLGSIQQLATPPSELVKAHLPAGIGTLAAGALPHVTGLLVIAEDQPQRDNGVDIDPSVVDRFGVPQLRITHRYSRRDTAAGTALVDAARSLLRRAGAWLTWVQPIRTFSHAVGTLRMGSDPARSAVDPEGRFRGTQNLYVTDASVFATSAGVNPSLTIAAGALRIGAGLAKRGFMEEPIAVTARMERAS